MRNAILTLALFAVSAIAAPAPYPVTINSRAQTAPPLTVYRAAESLFRVSFVDGDTASDITGATAFMSFATNASAAVVSTASVSVVSGMTGVVDCVFSPAAVNVAAGRYMYEVGVTPIGGTARIYRQGVFTVAASPYAGSAAAVTWATNMNWNTISWVGLPSYLTTVPDLPYTIITNAPWMTDFSGMTAADIIAAGGVTNTITDHATIPTGLLWTASGHYGTPARLAGFFEGGMAGYSYLGAGLYFGGSDELSVSNDIIEGAALGKTSLQSEADTNALAAIAALKIKMRWDTSDANVYDTIEGGTNWVVYRIATVPSATNYMVTLSDDFEETITHTRPAWTNNVFPFADGDWAGEKQYEDLHIMFYRGDSVWGNYVNVNYPIFMAPEVNAQGTATVSRVIVYPTQEVYRVDIPALTNINAVIQSIRASLTSISNTAEQAASDALSAQGDINNHTANGGIHVTSGDKELIDAVPGITQSVAAVSDAFAGFTNSIPAAGCSVLSMTDETNLVVTGATYAYTAQVATNYWLLIAPTAPAYHYSLTIYGTNACTLADNMRLIGTKTVTGTNCVAFKPWTNGLWEVLWGGK